MPHPGLLIFTTLAARHTPGVYMEEYCSVQFSSDIIKASTKPKARKPNHSGQGRRRFVRQRGGVSWSQLRLDFWFRGNRQSPAVRGKELSL